MVAGYLVLLSSLGVVFVCAQTKHTYGNICRLTQLQFTHLQDFDQNIEGCYELMEIAIIFIELIYSNLTDLLILKKAM